MTPGDAAADWQSFLAERPLAVLATAGRDGLPHAVPVEVVVRNGRAYVWCESDSVKARNALREMRATIMAYKGRIGAMLRGDVHAIRSGDGGYEEIAAAFLTKYEREETYGNDLIIEIVPRRVTMWE